MPLTVTQEPQLIARACTTKYGALFDALVAQPTEWFSVPCTDIAGPTPRRKQVTLHAAAATRHLKVQTRVRDEKMFVRLRPVHAEVL